jgi:hypothetical protein
LGRAFQGIAWSCPTQSVFLEPAAPELVALENL